MRMQVLPVYCFDPRFFKSSAWGTPKTGPHRAAFLLESVADLKGSLQQLGSGLVVAVGKPEEVIPGEAILLRAQIDRLNMQNGGWRHAICHHPSCTTNLP